MTKIIPPEKAAFLKFEIENGDARRRKVALQEVSRLYRSGLRLRSDVRNSFELTIIGLVGSEQDHKVVRWGLNSIAQLGTVQKSATTVQRLLQQYEGNPEITAAAIAATSHLYSGQLDEAGGLNNVSREIKVLAALQNTHPSHLDLEGFKIDIETADAEVLKLALITVGLNKSFENLFDPRHRNGQLVKVLGQHDDVVVRQYSVWAVIENKGLYLEDLGIPFDCLEREPPNVQSKLLQLAAEQLGQGSEKQGIIKQGTFLPSIDAREGLAKGLQYQYYDGLEEITLDWYGSEKSPRVKELIAEHFARFGEECGPYSEKVMDLLETEPGMQTRLLLGAEGTSLFGRIKANDRRSGTPDMFRMFGDDLIAAIKGTKNMTKPPPSKRVLMLCASPVNEDNLRLGAEARDIKEQLRLVDGKKVDIQVEHAWAVRPNQIQMEVLNSKPNILHFSGHGDTGLLCFEDGQGNSVEVSADAIAGVVEVSDAVECLLLNACYSDSIVSAASPHIQIVIGCNESILDDAAAVFSKAFYRALAHGHDYEKAFKSAQVELEIENMPKEAQKYVLTIRSST